MDKEFLQAIRQLIQEELAPINKKLVSIEEELDPINKKLISIENDVKYIKETHGEKLDLLINFEKNVQLAHEKIDTRLNKIEDGISVLAEEDFGIKTAIRSVKEDLKVIKGGK